METLELNSLWEEVKSGLLDELPENAHPWITPLEVTGYDKGVLTLVTGQMMGRDLLRRNYYKNIVSVLKNITKNPESDFVILYDENAAKSIRKENEKMQKKVNAAIQKEQAMENLSYMHSSSNLNLKYKFENFVVGKNNEFAYKVTKSVAENPAQKFNPLFIYGNSGLGKTHLMQAIGHYTIFKNPKLKVKYTKTEDYVNDFISNSRNSKDTIENMSKFNKKYTNIDIILIDDIQFIESKKKTMSQMQHTFDTLYNKGKQIVITSDRLPKDIPTLTSALCSRFEMGLMVELTPPDKENRINILKKLSNDVGLSYEEEALNYIAEYFSKNVRELEGAFNRVSAYADMSSCPLTIDLAKKVLKCDESDKELSFSKILEITAKYYGVSPEEVRGQGRTQRISTARHMAIYLTRELNKSSFVSIAEYYGKKHTTIMFAHDKVQKELQTSKELVLAAREIKQALKVI